MLTGDDLVSFVQANPGTSETDLASGAGYVRTTTTGKSQVLKKSFMTQLLAAKDLKVGADPNRNRGKAAQYVTTIHTNGVMLLGKTYTEDAGFDPGDKLQIVVSPGEVRVVLLQRAAEVEPRDSKGRFKKKEAELEAVAA